MNDNGMLNGNGGDSDGSANGDNMKICRDFIRNVCNRGQHCKFIHPENIKVRTDPIFCHDFQQGKCYRSTCKFIHCTREEEEHYKQTGELPASAAGYEAEQQTPPPMHRNNDHHNSQRSSRPMGNGNGNVRMQHPQQPQRKPNLQFRPEMNGNGNCDADLPICKDFLKGFCDRRPGGCKFRHVNEPTGYPVRQPPQMQNMQQRRRPGNPNYYESTEPKRQFRPSFGPPPRHHFDDDYANCENFDYDYQENPYSPNGNFQLQDRSPQGFSQHNQQNYQQREPTQPNYPGGHVGGRNGYSSQGPQLNAQVPTSNVPCPFYSNSQPSADAMKALEDENFMLKRRIEELKTANEFLLSQNAQLRLNNTLNLTKEGGQSAGSNVVQTLVSMAQPIGMTTSMTVAPTQPLTTMTTIPTVSLAPVTISSISAPLPVVSISHNQTISGGSPAVYPIVTAHQATVLPPPN